MSIKVVQGQAFAFGLKWSDYATLREARKALRGTPCKSYVLTTSKQEGKVRHVLGVTSDRTPRKCIPAGLALGWIHPDSVAAQEDADLGPNQWWIASIQGGVPAVGTDTWVDEAAARQEAKTGIALGQDGLIGNIAGARVSLDDALSQFVGEIKKGLVNKKRLGELTLRAKPSALTNVLLVAVLASVIAGGFGLWKVYEARIRAIQEQKKKLSELALTKAQQEEQEAKLRAARAKFEADVQAKRAELEALSVDGTGIYETWTSMRRQMPQSLGGYKPEVLECDRSRCSVTWLPAGPRVRYEDQKLLPGLIKGEPTLTPRSELELPARTATRGELVSAEHEALLNLVQISAPTARFEGPSPVIVSPPPDIGMKAQTVGMKGQFTYTSPPGYPFVGSDEVVQLLAGRGVFLTKVRFMGFTTDRATVLLEGGYLTLRP